MSRSYLVYVEAKDIPRQKWDNFFCRWCGKDQMWKTVEYGEDIYGFYEMGCSGGVDSIDTAKALKKQLEAIGAKEVHVKHWSLHPDDCIEAKTVIE